MCASAFRPRCFNQKNKPENDSSASIIVPIDEHTTKWGAGTRAIYLKVLRKAGAIDEELSKGADDPAFRFFKSSDNPTS
jgi:hypothetical protein